VVTTSATEARPAAQSAGADPRRSTDDGQISAPQPAGSRIGGQCDTRADTDIAMMTGPASMPVLQPGTHLTPEDGACLMEYVSLLAGRPFNDHPSCTDPTLALLARLVNDACTDRGRNRLSRFAVSLTETPPTDAVGSAKIVLSAVTTAAAAVDAPRRLERHVRGARRRLRRVTGGGPRASMARWLDVAHRQGAGRRRLEAAVSVLTALPEPERDARLLEILAAALVSLSTPSAASPRAG
jgi:hypothetical protein